MQIGKQSPPGPFFLAKETVDTLSSPFLYDRPVEAASDELVARARKVTVFLLDPEAGDGMSN